MLIDPYAVMHALLRAEAARGTKPQPKPDPESDAGEDSRPSASPGTERPSALPERESALPERESE